MTIKDLAKRLGIGYDAATALMMSEGFPRIRSGRRWVVDEVLYERWYMQHIGCTFPTEIKPEPKKRKARIQEYDMSQFDGKYKRKGE